MLGSLVVSACLSLSCGARPSIDAAAFVDPRQADCGLQAAIDAAADQGGGVVQVPAGRFPLRRGLVLRSAVAIVGAGTDKTVLVPDRKTVRLDVTADSPVEGRVFLKTIPAEFQVGSAVVSCREYPPSWYGSPRPAYVTFIDRAQGLVTLEAPYGLNEMKPGKGYLTFGDAAALAKDVHRGDVEIHLRDAGLFRAGDEVTLGEPPNESLLAHAFVKEVKGNTLVLESPVKRDFPAWPPSDKIGNTKVNALVWAIFPLLHAANVESCSVRDLTVQGHGFAQVRPMQTRYTLAGIHVYNGTGVVIEQVAVRDWPSDGISLQTGKGCRVSKCIVTGCLGNGLHPGTGLSQSRFEENHVSENGAGLYFCWHNRQQVVRKNLILRNRGAGIAGLGNPGDRENLIEENVIAENGGPGIEINGGLRSGNAIRRNLIENNSQAQPAKHPGIAIYASVEDARDYTIEANTIRDTQKSPTQVVGVEEQDGSYRGKPTHAYENLIRDNVFSGHRKADVWLTGPATRCERNGEATVRREPVTEP